MLILAQGQGNPNASIVFLRDFPSFEDARKQKHFEDGAGVEFRKMCAEAGIIFSETFSTTISRQVLMGKGDDLITTKKSKKEGKLPFDKLWVHPSFVSGLEKLQEEINLIKPNIIVPLGPLSLYLCNNEVSLNNWRGSVGYAERFGCKYLPTYDPAMILKVWNWRYAAVRDLQRVAHESTFPELQTPDYNFTIQPSYLQVMTTLQMLINKADEMGKSNV